MIMISFPERNSSNFSNSDSGMDIPMCAVVNCPGSVATMAGCEATGSDTGEGGMIIVSGQS